MTCLFCSCTDDAACPGGCSWVLEDRRGKQGVCSSCAGIRVTGSVSERFDAAAVLQLGPIDLALPEAQARRLLGALRRALSPAPARGHASAHGRRRRR